MSPQPPTKKGQQQLTHVIPQPNPPLNSFMEDNEDRRFYLNTVLGTQFKPSLANQPHRSLKVRHRGIKTNRAVATTHSPSH